MLRLFSIIIEVLSPLGPMTSLATNSSPYAGARCGSHLVEQDLIGSSWSLHEVCTTAVPVGMSHQDSHYYNSRSS